MNPLKGKVDLDIERNQGASLPVLVETSVWVEYFREGSSSEKLDFLIDENLLVTNDLVLAELEISLIITSLHSDNL